MISKSSVVCLCVIMGLILLPMTAQCVDYTCDNLTVNNTAKMGGYTAGGNDGKKKTLLVSEDWNTDDADYFFGTHSLCWDDYDGAASGKSKYTFGTMTDAILKRCNQPIEPKGGGETYFHYVWLAGAQSRACVDKAAVSGLAERPSVGTATGVVGAVAYCSPKDDYGNKDNLAVVDVGTAVGGTFGVCPDQRSSVSGITYGTTANAIGVAGAVNQAVTGGSYVNVTNAYGGEFGVSLLSGTDGQYASIGTAKSVYVKAPIKGGGTITHAYGIYVDNVSDGTSTNYSIYSGGKIRGANDVICDGVLDSNGTGTNTFSGNISVDGNSTLGNASGDSVTFKGSTLQWDNPAYSDVGEYVGFYGGRFKIFVGCPSLYVRDGMSWKEAGRVLKGSMNVNRETINRVGAVMTSNEVQIREEMNETCYIDRLALAVIVGDSGCSQMKIYPCVDPVLANVDGSFKTLKMGDTLIARFAIGADQVRELTQAGHEFLVISNGFYIPEQGL